MPDRRERVRPVRNPRAARWTLLVLTVVAVFLLARLVRPFSTAFFLAAVMAGALSPAFEWLVARLRGRRQVAAGIATLAVLFAVVLPVAGASVTVAREVSGGVTWVRATLRSEGVEGLVNRLPAPLRHGAARLLAQLPQGDADLQALTQRESARAAAAVGGVLSATWGVLIQLLMMMIAFYFLLVDGRELVRWAADVLPLRPGQTVRLLAEFRKVSVTVIVSTVATAALQTAVALAGYAIARVPNPLFFAVITFLFALVPFVGATGVVLGAAVLLYFSGHTGHAVFLGVWAIAAVSLLDHVVKPYLIRGGVAIHGAVIFFALVAGLATFGPIGLLAGPLIVSFFLAVVRMWQPEVLEEPVA